MLNRRGLITGLISFVAAPAIVRAASLMPVKADKYKLTLQGIELVFDREPDPMMIHLLNLRMAESFNTLKEHLAYNVFMW